MAWVSCCPLPSRAQKKQKMCRRPVEPPQGLHPKLTQWLMASGASRIIYVSCNPATLARDLRVMCGGTDPGARGEAQLAAEGAKLPPTTPQDSPGAPGRGPYALRWVQPVDLFPQTGHIEAVALLTKI